MNLQHVFPESSGFVEMSISLALVGLALFLFQQLVHYASTIRFYRTLSSDTLGKRPPTVPYQLPGICHALGLLSGAPAFFARSIRKYGNQSPFVLKAGPKSFMIIRDPDHVKKVFSSSKRFTRNIFHVFVFEKIMGIPKGTLEPLIESDGKRAVEKDQIETAHTIFPRKFLTGPFLDSLSDVYISSLRRNLLDKTQDGAWTNIDDLWSFFQQVTTVATIESLFGSELLRRNPNFVNDYWAFDDNAEDFVREFPRFLAPSTYATRDRLHEGIEAWLQSAHAGKDFAKVNDEDPTWDASMGSKFCQASDSVLANMPSFNLKARAAEVLSFILGANSNTMPYLFWSTVHILLDPTLKKHLASDIAQHHDAKSRSFDIAAINNIPVIQSIQTEIGRLRIGTVVARTSTTDVALDDSWTVPKGQSITIFNHDISHNTEMWEKIRPQALAKPLHEFFAERFLVPSKSALVPESSSEKKTERSDIWAGKYSTEGLSSLLLTFGGGQSLCPGRFFVKAIQAGTLAVLLSEFEMEFTDSGSTERALPPPMQFAYGPIKPLERVSLRIRRRNMSEI